MDNGTMTTDEYASLAVEVQDANSEVDEDNFKVVLTFLRRDKNGLRPENSELVLRYFSLEWEADEYRDAVAHQIEHLVRLAIPSIKSGKIVARKFARRP